MKQRGNITPLFYFSQILLESILLYQPYRQEACWIFIVITRIAFDSFYSKTTVIYSYMISIICPVPILITSIIVIKKYNRTDVPVMYGKKSVYLY
jgi:hypothetical protein